MKKVIYLDNAATTKVRPEVVEAMLPFYTEYYGNPSAVYEFSTPCKEALAKARETVANSLGAKDNEIYFTNGGSESDNWALIATAEAYASKGKHIITTKIEHHAILHTCEWLEKHGYEVTYLPVDENGVVKIDELKKAMEGGNTADIKAKTDELQKAVYDLSSKVYQAAGAAQQAAQGGDAQSNDNNNGGANGGSDNNGFVDAQFTEE